MVTTLLSAGFAPFSMALALLVALFVLELVALMIGGSVFGAGESDLDVSPEIAALEASFDLDPGELPDVGALNDASAALEGLAPEASGVTASPGILGLGQAPFMVWFAALLLGFGVAGFGLQTLADTVFGGPLPLWVAAPVAGVFGLGFARRFARVFGRLLPGIETSATSAQFMGGLRGTVTQGVARTGSPAEVQLHDRHGNVHHMRCEPFRAADIIPEGTDVLMVRERDGNGGWRLRILPLG